MSGWKAHLVTAAVTIAVIAAVKRFVPKIGQYI